jgi:hypothetical protein
MKTTNPYTTPFIDVSPLDNYIAKREPPPLPPAESKVIHMILTVVGVIFMLLAIAVGKVVSKDVTKWLFSKNTSTPTSTSDTSWTRYAIENVSFDSPTPIVGPGENTRSQVTGPMKSLITSVYEYTGSAYHGSFLIRCVRMTFASNASYNLDAGIQGAISQAAQTLGDKSPRYTLTSVRVDGLEARRVTYDLGDGDIAEVLLVVDHKGIAWLFMAFGEPKYAKDAQRIIDSVHVANK